MSVAVVPSTGRTKIWWRERFEAPLLMVYGGQSATLADLKACRLRFTGIEALLR